MLSAMPQVNVRVPDAVLSAAKKHRFQSEFASQQKAYVDLLVEGLEKKGLLSKEEAGRVRKSEGIRSDDD